MAAAELAIDLLRSHGARTASRLRALVDHLAAHYGEDPDQQFADAHRRAEEIGMTITQRHRALGIMRRPATAYGQRGVR